MSKTQAQLALKDRLDVTGPGSMARCHLSSMNKSIDVTILARINRHNSAGSTQPHPLFIAEGAEESLIVIGAVDPDNLQTTLTPVFTMPFTNDGSRERRQYHREGSVFQGGREAAIVAAVRYLEEKANGLSTQGVACV